MTCEKKYYRTKRIAKTRAKRSSVPLYPYHCQHCDGFHLSYIKPGVYREFSRTAEKLRNDGIAGTSHLRVAVLLQGIGGVQQVEVPGSNKYVFVRTQ